MTIARSHPSARRDHSDSTTRTLAFVLLLVAVALTFLPWLGITPFYSPGEPREAVAALSMLNTGNWVLPLSYGDMTPCKPPFLAWCIALISLIPGHVTEYTSRLPSAIALIILVMATYRFWAPRIGAGTAMVGSIILFTCFEVYRAGIACRVDMMLTMFVVTAAYTLYVWAMELDLRGVPWGAVLLMSGAALTNGPVGIVLPLLMVWVTVAFCGHRLWGVTWRMLLLGLASLVIPLLWYLAAWQRGGEPFLRLVVAEHFGCLTGTAGACCSAAPWWYNPVTLVGGMAPYTLLLLMALTALLVPDIRHAARESLMRWRTVDAVKFFLYVAPAVVLIFYCFPSGKSGACLLPMYPFLAMQGALLALWLARRACSVVKVFTAFMAFVAMAAFALWILAHCPAVTTRFTPDLSIRAMESIAGFLAPAPVWTYLLTGAVALVGAVLFVRQFRDGGTSVVIGMCVSVILLYWAFGAVYLPAAVSGRSDREMACEIARLQPAGTIYAYAAADKARFFTADFYLGDRLETFNVADCPVSGLLLTGDSDGEDLRGRLAGTVELTPVKNWEKRSCDVSQPVTLWRYRLIEDNQPVP